VTSSYGGGGVDRVGGGEGVSPVAAPSQEVTSNLSVGVTALELRGMAVDKTSRRWRTYRWTERAAPVAVLSVSG
jgi:hypothetical protein